MATDRMTWRGLIWREVGLTLLHLSPLPPLPLLGCQDRVPRRAVLAGGLAAVLVPRSPPPWFARKAGKQGGGRGRTELAVRMGPC